MCAYHSELLGIPLDAPLLPSPSASYRLAIHTTSPELGLAISNHTGESRSHVWPLGRDLSTHLHLYLVEFLQPQTWNQLEFIAVAKGPGGFTGTRIGVVTARTLAQQLEIPLFGVSTLAAIAWSNRTQVAAEAAIAVQMLAQRGDLFVAIYQRSQFGLQPRLPDTVMHPDHWQQTLAEWATPYHLVTSADVAMSVDSVLDLAALDWQQGERPHWSEVLPFYGQHPVVMG